MQFYKYREIDKSSTAEVGKGKIIHMTKMSGGDISLVNTRSENKPKYHDRPVLYQRPSPDHLEMSELML